MVFADRGPYQQYAGLRVELFNVPTPRHTFLEWMPRHHQNLSFNRLAHARQVVGQAHEYDQLRRIQLLIFHR